MIGVGAKPRSDGSGERDRGVSPLVGVVLLVGMVLFGAALLFAVGMPMLESVEAESEGELARHCMDEADHRLATVAGTGERQTLPSAAGSDCRLDVADDGRIEMIWYEDDEYDGDVDDLPWENDSRTASAELGALEFELEDRTIAHQGGGVWERRDEDGETIAISEPRIGYDSDSGTVQLELMQLDEAQLSADEPIARADPDRTERFHDEVRTAASNSDGDNVAIRIHSSYYDGWERQLERALGADENGNVAVESDSSSETAVATIGNVREVDEFDEVLITEDHGVDGDGVTDGRVVHPDEWDSNPDPHLEVTATFENYADEERTIRPTLEIVGEDVESRSNSPVRFEAGERKTVTMSIPPGHYGDLDAGERYEYTITTADDSLDEYGSFFLGDSDSSFDLTDDDIETTDAAGTITISATVTNTGIEADTQDITLDFGGDAAATRELSLESGADGTVSWTLDESAFPGGTHEFIVETDDDSATGAIRVEGDATEQGFVIVEDLGVQDGPGETGDQRVDATTSTFTIATEVRNTDFETETQVVELAIPDAGITATEPVTLESGETEIVSFDLETADLEPGSVYEYTVSTDDAELTDPGAFYVGEPGSAFELLDATISRDEDAGSVTVAAELQNVGLEEGRPDDVALDLEYLDGETPEEYAFEPRPVDSTFEFGQAGTVGWEFNESRLLDGEYEVTVRFVGGDEEETASFEVTVDGDSDETGIAVGEPIAAEVTVLGTQVSTYDGDDHTLIPTTLSLVTESGGERTVQHTFRNDDAGTNINTYDSWQAKGTDRWTESIEIDEDDIAGDEVNLTLSATSEYCPFPDSCWFDDTVSDGDGTHYYMDDVNEDNAWISIDATTGDSLANVRVRDHERDDIPPLRRQHDLQMTSNELLEREGLWDEETETLDLDEGEYVFLFEVTQEAEDPSDIDELWNQATDSDSGDPNFNDLIVHVDVERANVDVSDPLLTLSQEQSTSPTVENGSGTADGGDTSLEIGDGDVSSGAGPTIGTGSSEEGTEASESETETGLDLDADTIIIG